MYEIIPGILEKEWSEIEKKIELVKSFAKTVHIDLADGKFVPNATFLDPQPFKKYSSDIFFELHMMVEEPVNYLNTWAKAGFRRFLGHIEKMSDQVEFIAKGQLLGEVGLAIDGPTPLEAVKAQYDDLDCILVMTIKAGFSGQFFMPEKLDKVKSIREKTMIPIEVDGGINDSTVRKASDAGATRCVSTSFIFHNQNPQSQFQKLRDSIKQEA